MRPFDRRIQHALLKALHMLPLPLFTSSTCPLDHLPRRFLTRAGGPRRSPLAPAQVRARAARDVRFNFAEEGRALRAAALSPDHRRLGPPARVQVHLERRSVDASEATSIVPPRAPRPSLGGADLRLDARASSPMNREEGRRSFWLAGRGSADTCQPLSISLRRSATRHFSSSSRPCNKNAITKMARFVSAESKDATPLGNETKRQTAPTCTRVRHGTSPSLPSSSSGGVVNITEETTSVPAASACPAAVGPCGRWKIRSAAALRGAVRMVRDREGHRRGAAALPARRRREPARGVPLPRWRGLV